MNNIKRYKDFINESSEEFKVGQRVRIEGKKGFFEIKEKTSENKYKLAGAWKGGETIEFEVDGSKLSF